MEILRSKPNGSFERSGMRCDRCRIDYRFHRDLADLFAVQEFVRINIHAGYGADHFADGDSWSVDLCEACAHKLLAPYARLVRSYEERELAAAAASLGANHPHVDERMQFAIERRRNYRAARARC